MAEPIPLEKERGFVRELGLVDSVMIVAGSMIGSGIFIVSADIGRQMNSPGGLVMVWAAMGVFGAITSAVNHAWKVEKQPSYLKHKLVSFVMMAGASTLLVIGFSSSTCFPFSNAFLAIGKCVCTGVAITTASSSLSAKRSSICV